MQPACHLVVVDDTDRTAGDLCPSYLRTRVAAQTGQATDRLGEEPLRSGEPDMPVVRVVAHHHVGAQSEPGQEVPVGIAVPDEGVHDADVRRAGVEVQPDLERQPVAVAPVQPYDGTHGPVLLDRDLFDLGGGPLAVARTVVVGYVLSQAHQSRRPHDLPTAVLDRRDEVRAAQPPRHRPGADPEIVSRPCHGDGFGRRAGLTTHHHLVRRGWVVLRADRVGRPLDRAVRPGGRGPAL
jgi:hypothetical protein